MPDQDNRPLDVPPATSSPLESHRIRVPPSAWPSSSSSSSTTQPSPGQDGFFYIPNFITEHEEAYILEKVNTAPLPKWKSLQNRRLQYWGGMLSNKGALIPEPMPDWLVSFPALIERVRNIGAFEGSAHGEANHCLVNEYQAGQGIMPHEDGGAYFPSVATISLGSHTLLDIYRYRYASEGGDADGTEGASTEGQPRAQEGGGGAKVREQDPVFSIFQERRSLLVTRGSAYTSFLHGIAERSSDSPLHLSRVANASALHDAEVRTNAVLAVRSGGQMGDEVARELRVSLTLRDVERVSKGLGALMASRLGVTSSSSGGGGASSPSAADAGALTKR